MEYDNLDIEISERRVKISGTRIGDANEEFQPDHDLLLRSYLPLMRSDSDVNEDIIVAFGILLYKTVFPHEIDSMFKTALSLSRDHDAGIRIRIRTDGGKISDLPFEYLYIPGQEFFLATNPETVISRYLPVPRAARDLKAEYPVRVLLLAPRYPDSDSGALERQLANIRNALCLLESQKLVEIETLLDATSANIRSILRTFRPSVCHYIGCGYKSGDDVAVTLLDDAGNQRLLGAHEFGEFFLGPENTLPRLFLLSSQTGSKVHGFVETATQLIQRGVHAAVTTQFNLPADSSYVCFREFYKAITDGSPVDYAVQEARKAMRQDIAFRKQAFGSVVLFMRASDGRIFDFSSEGNKQAQHPRKTSRSVSVDLTKRPYKNLDYYETVDADIFFGRDHDIADIASKIISHRSLIIYGESGAGKSSIINAGVIPNVCNRDKGNEKALYLPIQIRTYGTDLTAKIHGKVQSLLTEYGIDHSIEFGQLELYQALLTPYRLLGVPIVLFFDQFEDFFITLGDEERAKFIAEVSKCIWDENLEIHFVYSLRQDFFSRMGEFKDKVPGIFHNTFYLKRLAKDEARQAIVEPVRQREIEYEPELVDVLLDDLYEEGIIPPQLQIICDTLYSGLYQGQRKITLSMYKGLGEAEKILTDYLDRVLMEFPTSGQRFLAKEVLKCLISTSDTKLILGIKELSEKTGRDERELKDIVETLVRSRVLRIIEREYENLYELAHEFLVIKIKGWLSPEELEIRKAKGILEFEYKSYRDSSSLMPLDRLRMLHQSRELIDLRLDDNDRCILLRAALEYDYEVLYWLGKNIQNHVAIAMLQKLIASSENTRLQIWAAAGLIGMTTDESARQQATKVLLGYPGKGESLMRVSLISKLNQESSRRAAALLKNLIADLTKDMAYIPAGEFLMGSNDGLPGESPVHTVLLDAFWMDKCPVTIGQFREFLTHTRAKDHIWLTNFQPGMEHLPVIIVDWHEANAYCQWLGKKLPTEAQWEKAARGGLQGKKFPWGDEDPTTERANFNRPNEGPTPVGIYPPNGYGIFDMAGNVEEWVTDWFSDEYYRQSPRTNPSGPPLGLYKVTRGGAYIRNANEIRCAMRYLFQPHQKGPVTGFRAALSEDSIRALLETSQ